MNFIDPLDREELRDIAIGFMILTFALTILFYGGVFVNGIALIYALPLAAVITMTAFLGHELMHRHFAREFGGFSRFKLWPMGALLALITSLFGFLFAAPGAVYFTGVYEEEKVGKIALAGPAWNIAVGVFFYGIFMFSGNSPIAIFAGAVGRLNLWFGLFNLIPVWVLDGAKVWKWSHETFVVVFAIAILANFLVGAF